MAANNTRLLKFKGESRGHVVDGAISEQQSELLEQTFKLSDFAIATSERYEETPLLQCDYDIPDFVRSCIWGSLHDQLAGILGRNIFVIKDVKGLSIAFGDTSNYRCRTNESEIHCYLFVNRSWDINDGGAIIFGDEDPTLCVFPKVERLLIIGSALSYLLTTPSRFATTMLLMLRLTVELEAPL